MGKSGPNATFNLNFLGLGWLLGWEVRRFHNNDIYSEVHVSQPNIIWYSYRKHPNGHVRVYVHTSYMHGHALNRMARRWKIQNKRRAECAQQTTDTNPINNKTKYDTQNIILVRTSYI